MTHTEPSLGGDWSAPDAGTVAGVAVTGVDDGAVTGADDDGAPDTEGATVDDPVVGPDVPLIDVDAPVLGADAPVARVDAGMEAMMTGLFEEAFTPEVAPSMLDTWPVPPLSKLAEPHPARARVAIIATIMTDFFLVFPASRTAVGMHRILAWALSAGARNG